MACVNHISRPGNSLEDVTASRCMVLSGEKLTNAHFKLVHAGFARSRALMLPGSVSSRSAHHSNQ